jgi:hypothetical protein
MAVGEVFDKTAQAVATHDRHAAVVVDHGHGRLLRAAGPQQQAVGADAGKAVTQPLTKGAPQVGRQLTGVDHSKVVAQTVVFGKRQQHHAPGKWQSQVLRAGIDKRLASAVCVAQVWWADSETHKQEYPMPSRRFQWTAPFAVSVLLALALLVTRLQRPRSQQTGGQRHGGPRR